MLLKNCWADFHVSWQTYSKFHGELQNDPNVAEYIFVVVFRDSSVVFAYVVLCFRSVSQFYGSGDICDVTGQPRHTEVKLK